MAVLARVRVGHRSAPPPRPSKSIPISSPRTWLATTGWRERGGGLLNVNEAPAIVRKRGKNGLILKRAVVAPTGRPDADAHPRTTVVSGPRLQT